MKIFFNGLLLIALLFPGLKVFAAGEDPCIASKRIWAERLIYDVSMRRERTTLGKKILEYRTRIINLEPQIADVEEKISKNPPNKDELWEKFDALGAERDSLFVEMVPYSKKYEKVSSERRMKRAELKQMELAKKFECAINKPLNEKLEKLVSGLNEDKRFSPEKKAEILGLINEKNIILNGLTAEYKKYSDEITKAYNGLLNVENNYFKLLADEDEIDKQIDDGHEGIYLIFEKAFDKIDSESEKIGKISDSLLKILDNK